MINSIILFVIVALVMLGLVDGILYVAVKIKEKCRKKQEKSETNILLNENESKNVPS